MAQKQVERDGIYYVGAKDNKQVLYRIGNNIITACTTSRSLQEFIKTESKRKSSPSELTDRLKDFFKKKRAEGTATIAGNSRRGFDSYTINLKSGNVARNESTSRLEDLVSCNQFGFISPSGAKALYDPDISLAFPPEEYSGFFNRTRESKEKINQQVYDIFNSLLSSRNDASQLIKKLSSAYISHGYGFLDNLDFNRELAKIEKKLRTLNERKRPNVLVRTYKKAKEELFDAVSSYRRRETKDLVLDIPKAKEKDQREEYLQRIGSRFSVQGYSMKYSNSLSISCASREVTEVIKAFKEEFCTIYGSRDFKIRPAILYFIPEMIHKVEGPGDIVIGPITVNKVKLSQKELWNLKNIGAYEANKKTEGDGVNVAIIDTGIDYRHPDLSGVYNGGYNFVSNNDKPFDGNGHGTHVSGTVAGCSTGVAPSANIYALKVLSDEGYGSEMNIVRAIEWCIDNDIDVINMSLGGPYPSHAGEQVCKKAAESGILICAAAGNSGYGKSYPASYPGVISIAAVDCDNEHADFSNICDTLDLSAPGVKIVSTWPGNSYNEISGTSMASPHATGVCALAVSYFKTSSGIEDKMESCAEDLGSGDMYGCGLVRADKLVELAARRYKHGTRQLCKK